jgi:hypothetical protein
VRVRVLSVSASLIVAGRGEQDCATGAEITPPCLSAIKIDRTADSAGVHTCLLCFHAPHFVLDEFAAFLYSHCDTPGEQSIRSDTVLNLVHYNIFLAWYPIYTRLPYQPRALILRNQSAPNSSQIRNLVFPRGLIWWAQVVYGGSGAQNKTGPVAHASLVLA